MTKKEWAQIQLYELYNNAEHAYRMVQGAQVSLDRDDPTDAIADLEISRSSIGLLEMRLADAIGALQALAEKPK